MGRRFEGLEVWKRAYNLSVETKVRIQPTRHGGTKIRKINIIAFVAEIFQNFKYLWPVFY
jgi:hypothetical protein